MKRFIAFGACVIALTGAQTFAACGVDDANFVTADGGCKDLATGLVWSSDLLSVNTNYGISDGGLMDKCLDPGFTPQRYAEAAPYSDWRLPTLSEVQQALANDLASHLDFYYDDGFQGPEENIANGRYRWVSTRKRITGALLYYSIRYTDGDAFASVGNHSPSVICVRGAPPNEDPGPGNSNGKGGGKKNTLSRTTTSGLLMSPLAFVLASCGLRRRWS